MFGKYPLLPFVPPPPVQPPQPQLPKTKRRLIRPTGISPNSRENTKPTPPLAGIRLHPHACPEEKVRRIRRPPTGGCRHGHGHLQHRSDRISEN
jgi:hypothetical protein